MSSTHFPALPWPPEPAGPLDATRFDVPQANWLLDFHGSLQDPDLVLFMAGNQFRALPQLLQAFRDSAPARDLGVDRIFYATTPPGRLVDAMASGRLASGNFVIEIDPQRLWPDAFMAGPREHQRLAAAGHIEDAASAATYARNRGVALLVRAGNPLGITQARDLARDDVRVAISTKEREGTSFASYSATLDAQGGAGLTEAVVRKGTTRHSQFVHHREVPQLIADGRADAGPVYLHIATYLAAAMPDIFDVVVLPEAGNFRDELSIVLLRDTPRPAAARAWRDFLLGPDAAPLLARHGFDAPG
ncbi:molybdate ABC transporter substrate-binding protein [Xenophilus aerolatus]|nr:substrate-binding domain-containing protein [Xenophilus aerolatus]